MRRKPDNFPLVLWGGALGLWILFHTIWNILFEDWLKHQLEHVFRHTVAELIERFGSVGFPALAAIAIVWFLSLYIRAQAKAEVADLAASPMHSETRTRKTSSYDPSWKRDATMSEALWRAFSGEWGVRQPFSSSHKDPELARLWDVAGKLRQQAFEGRLPVWGRRPRSTLYEPVPETFWGNHAINGSYSAHPKTPDVFIYVTHALKVGEVPNARTTDWVDFMTSKTAVDNLWQTSSAPVQEV